MTDLSYIPAPWPGEKPLNVSAYTTLRRGGVSKAGYSQFNLATHVGDDHAAVRANRQKLSAELGLPAEPYWLDQVHSNRVVHADAPGSTAENCPVTADASISNSAGVVCVVLTADCLPVFFCNRDGSEVALAHAGWRGLHDGILSNTLAEMKSAAGDVQVSLGPAIGARAFEVGIEVYDAFVGKDPVNSSAFVPTDKDHYLCDIYRLARNELSAIGIAGIAGGDYCTFNEPERFYSYRRQKNTGRMASLIWFR
jgi:YfiH family protein